MYFEAPFSVQWGMENTEAAFGTRERASQTFNFISGCSNDCVYCYAKEMAIRFKRKSQDT